MIPRFTAEAAVAARYSYGPAAPRPGDPDTVVPAWLPFTTAPGASCTCPCCQAHDCGFLGLYTCVDCC